jgi:hypothetical protein
MNRIKLLSAIKLTDRCTGDIGAVLSHLTFAECKGLVTQRLAEWIEWDPQDGPKMPTRAELDLEEVTSLQEQAEAPADEPPPPPKKPYGNASVDAWRRYAVAIDSELTPEQAQLVTKADLMSRYGERLL